MGGRGAASGLNYGSEYRTLFQSGDIKFVERRDGRNTTAPIETRTEGRIYATIHTGTEELHSISVMRDGKVRSQIDFRDHKGMGVHSHDWSYKGDEIVRGGARPMTADERRLYDKVSEVYGKYRKRGWA